MKSRLVRQKFLDFFRSRGHEIVPSAPMVIKDDATLMFTNAGMNQFKDIFLENAPVRHPRIADTQKCLRVSGKHNDLEEVGFDGYHHTMFEMLGNWSFGDYFKQEAIGWAWEFLTEEIGIERDRIYVTYFEGDPSESLESDLESLGFWKRWVEGDRILPGSKKDNFWEMGDSGPCGPCSEIHVDLRSEEERRNKDGRELVNKGDPLVIEIWNLVFIQYNRTADGNLTALPRKHVDTGMGFERLCMVVQGKTSNYDTDIFQPIIGAIASLSGRAYGSDDRGDVAMRVVADHLRSVAFAISDGQLPSNTKAGYVIRRILRRAVRYYYTYLGLDKPFMFKLMPALIESMGDVFPELVAQRATIERVIHEEEQSFLRTLAGGIKLLEQITADLRQKNEKTVSGKTAFELYDTFGFPLDLTELMLKDQGMNVDRAAFDREMEAQRERSRSATAVRTDDWVSVGPDQEEEAFVGYENTRAIVRMSRYRKVSGRDRELYHLVFNTTPFYPESGGQVGDTGYIDNGIERIPVINTFREHGLVIHVTERIPADVNLPFEAVVDRGLRMNTASNHTATHLLHQALREVLGRHVEQKGSLVNPDYLRFDFSHFRKMTDDEVRQVESAVNKKIREGLPRDEMRGVPVGEAIRQGAVALFGEKYGDRVRVIRFGDSVELCGGTHVDTTGQIGLFKILSEGSIASGIRRIEAITGEKAEAYCLQLESKMKLLEKLLNNPQNIVDAVESLLKEKSALEKKVEEFNRRSTESFRNELLRNRKQVGDLVLITGKPEGPVEDASLIRDVAFQIRNEVDNLYLVIGAVIHDKPHLAVMISEKVVREKKLHAGEIVKKASREFNGGGGGQPFFATAGGRSPENLSRAIDKAAEFAYLAATKKEG